MSEPIRLILWDVDGTLISAGPVARVAFDLAVERVVGRHPGEHGVQMGGKTDPQIAMEILATMAMSESEAGAHLTGVLAALERALEDAVHRIREDGRVLPGVPEVLSRLHAHPRVLQTLLTGNLAPNARLKVGAFGLDRWLDLHIAATGSDHEDRTRLVPLALERATARAGRRIDPSAVWVVGDTPLDLACARAGGARCLLVATGRVPIDELAEAGADAVLPDLTDAPAVESILLGTSAAGGADRSNTVTQP